jgi:hypothetical protein
MNRTTVFGLTAGISIVFYALYYGYLGSSSAVAVSIMNANFSQNDCVIALGKWKPMEREALHASDKNIHFYAVEFAKIRFECVNGPFKERVDYIASDAISQLASTVSVVEEAKAALVKEQNKIR